MDQQNWDAEERRAQRAARRRTTPKPATPADVMPDVERDRHLRVASGRPVFELADLPPSGDRGIPEVRKAFIAFCRQHPGRWVRYNAAGIEDSTATALRHQVRRRTGGFTDGFEGALRQLGSDKPSLYVRYVSGGDRR